MITQLGANLALARRNVFRQRRRALFALAAIMGGVVSFLLAGGFMHWVFESMRESTIRSQLGHVQITRPGYFAQGLADPYNYLLPTDTSIARSGPDDGIAVVAPRLAFSGLISHGDDAIGFLGEGIDPALEYERFDWVLLIEGRDLHDAPPNSTMLGVGLAENLGVRSGDSVVLLVTTADGGINAVELLVSGIFQTSTQAYDDTSLRVPIEVARELMRVEGATSWVLLLDQTPATDPTVSTLRARLPSDSFEVTPWHDLADFYNKTVVLFEQQVAVLRFLIAVIVVLSIANTLSMAVVERTTEIGTAMALGVKRLSILGQFVLEGVLLGLAGGVLGVVFGVILANVISFIGIPMPPPPGMAMGFIGEIRVTTTLVADAFIIAFVTTLLASLLPAWKASRLNIVDAIRHQG